MFEVGIDLIHISRIKDASLKYGEHFLRRFLNEDELKLVTLESNINYQKVAGVWALKEACAKALKTGIGRELSFHDMVYFKTSSAPNLTLSPRALEKFKVKKISVSLSHDKDLLIAICNIFKD
ncbi:hypothetical protein BKH43_01085 [Helicobacter sp. 13S00401-1]|uniref:holo-ACP synthase n=1 Tax=Helicobacter sp. 13S00401-1 TaxID=1905758 RepID=UPI000BA70742|nr:holo-ACP synthase [Helicobacter sp. 13S00401-1]PAF51858.1 hypothetical protein BKH43_01085 [Helicobacter sp. 13S00401-1]